MLVEVTCEGIECGVEYEGGQRASAQEKGGNTSHKRINCELSWEPFSLSIELSLHNTRNMPYSVP